MFYTIYKTTNKVNGKFYIGMHKTNNLEDGYMGSGKLLNRAIEKYGIDNFEKEILFIFDNESDMISKEKELITEEFVLKNDNYNLLIGGKGGFGYINFTGLSNNLYNEENSNFYGKKAAERKRWLFKNDPEWAENFSKSMSINAKKRTSEQMKKLSESARMKNLGSIWITDGTSLRKIKKENIIPEGWRRGRI